MAAVSLSAYSSPLSSVRLEMIFLAVQHLIQRVGPGGHRLGLEGLLLKGGGHLRRHHPPEVVLHVHLLHAAVRHQHPEGVLCGGRLRHSLLRRRLQGSGGRFRVGRCRNGGRQGLVQNDCRRPGIRIRPGRQGSQGQGQQGQHKGQGNQQGTMQHGKSLLAKGFFHSI